MLHSRGEWERREGTQWQLSCEWDERSTPETIEQRESEKTGQWYDNFLTVINLY